jgi:hypothetical protein
MGIRIDAHEATVLAHEHAIASQDHGIEDASAGAHVLVGAMG